MFAFALTYVLLKEKKIKELMSTTKSSMLWAMSGGIGLCIALFFQALAYERLPASIATVITRTKRSMDYFNRNISF